MSATILVIDDDPMQLQVTETILRECHGYQTIMAHGGRAAIERFLLRTDPKPDLVLLDLIMPEVSGTEVVRAIRRSEPHVPIVLLSPRDQHARVMEAIRAGANDCLQKPANIHYLRLTIEKHLQREQMRAELARLERYQRHAFSFEDVVGDSKVMRRCVRRAEEVARQSLPLWIEGDAGTGKELLARVVHSQSACARLPLRVINGERPANLRAMLSLKAAMERGGLLLRRVDRLPMPAQQLFAEQLPRFETSGVRLMATSRVPLAELYRHGRLHEALYAAFSTQQIALPALRERLSDLGSLSAHYLQRFTATYPFSVRRIDEAGLDLLRGQEWQGNVMELVHFLQRAAYYAHEPVLGAHIIHTLLEHPNMPIMPSGEIATPVHAPERAGDYNLLGSHGEVKPFDQIEADIIRFAIEHYRGKMTEVARKLGIGRSTLYRKMQDYRLREAA